MLDDNIDRKKQRHGCGHTVNFTQPLGYSFNIHVWSHYDSPVTLMLFQTK